MEEYSQPNFYHFSRDSIDLVDFAVTKMKDLSKLNVLDIGAGCGVIGIDFSQKHESVKSLSLSETQAEFGPYIEQNLKFLSADILVRIFLGDFFEARFNHSFDLILCNPPFYPFGGSRACRDANKKKCHSFEGEFYLELFSKVKKLLNKNGQFFFLGRKDIPFIADLIENKKIQEEKYLGKTSIFGLA